MQKSLVFLFLVFASLFVKAQADFRIGYIVTNQEDSVFGAIKFRPNVKNYQSCLFKSGGKIIEYFPSEVAGFGLQIEDRTYVSSVVEGQFVEVVLEGSISVYKHSRSFFVKKDDQVYSLEDKTVQVEIDGKPVTEVVSNWRNVLAELVGDCPEAAQVLRNYFQLTENNLLNLVINYNECLDLDYEIAKKQKIWSRFDFGVAVGAVSSSLNIEPTTRFEFLGAAYKSVNPSLGLVIAIPLPGTVQRFALQAEAHFFKSSYSALVMRRVGLRTEYHDTFIDVSTVSVPISVRYSKPLSRKHTLQTFAGFNYDSNVLGSTRLLSENIVANVVTTLPETEPFGVNGSQFGVWFGAGLLRSFKKFNVSANIRYSKISTLNKAEQVAILSNLSVRNNRISATIILFKK